MKTIISFFSLALAVLSFPTFANKVVITGEPVTLQQNGEDYSLPQDYRGSTSYYYVTVNGSKRVCYLTEQPSLASLNLLLINVDVGGKKTKWSCYPVDETYFQVNP